jgi:hypothetical protein
MATTMNMSGYEIERDADAVEEYGDEVMYAEWLPQLEQVSDLPVGRADKRTAFTGELANVDVDTFLEKMYKYQH